jgi:hypothetical protein
MFVVMEGECHGPLKSGSSILKAKRHFPLCECTPRTYKIHFMLILEFYLDLIIPKKTIHKRKDLTMCTFINNLVNEWGGKIIFSGNIFLYHEIPYTRGSYLFFFYRNKV